MAALLTHRERRLLEHYDRLKTFLEDEENREYFAKLTSDYRENNREPPELLEIDLQINYMRGCLEVLSDDLHEILVAILGDQTGDEAG